MICNAQGTSNNEMFYIRFLHKKIIKPSVLFSEIMRSKDSPKSSDSIESAVSALGLLNLGSVTKKSTSPCPSDFKSYEDLKNYTIGQISDIGLCPSLKDEHPEKYIYFRDLFQRHPDAERKKVDKIEDIFFKRFPKVSRRKRVLQVCDYQIHIRTSDGDEDSISWVKSMRREDYSIEKKLTSAMRHSIEGQIRIFRLSQMPTPCVECGTKKELTVDHINHFEGLSYYFLKLHPDHPVEFSEDPVTNQDCFREEDDTYRKLWQNYHKEEANLQILCIGCNQGRIDWKCPVVPKDKRWKPKEGAWK